MADVSVTISQELMDKLDEYAQAAGHASGAELAVAILEREVAKLADSEANEKIEGRLRGLGYIS